MQSSTGKLSNEVQDMESKNNPLSGNRRPGQESSQVSDIVSTIKQGATDVDSKAQEFGENAVDETSSMIRRYPGRSLAVGLGIGCLVGILIARR